VQAEFGLAALASKSLPQDSPTVDIQHKHDRIQPFLATTTRFDLKIRSPSARTVPLQASLEQLEDDDRSKFPLHCTRAPAHPRTRVTLCP